MKKILNVCITDYYFVLMVKRGGIPLSGNPFKKRLKDETRIGHFSHMTKSPIFKILDLRGKVNGNLKNRIRHRKFHSNPPH